MSRTRFALLIVLALLVAAAPAAARPAATTATTVTVKMKEFRFILSRSTVHHGKVIFVVINVGKINHDFKINGKKTASIAPGKRAKLVVTFAKAGRYPYLCVIGQHWKFGMKGRLKVT